jgi:hypothetical protein
MLQTNFKRFFLEETLDFLWRQWSTLGVAGGARAEETWVIDPEALLIFSLDLTRYDPRLFDEILDWMVTNAKWLDNQRLRRIIRKKNDETKRLLSTVAEIVSMEAKTYKRKWHSIGILNKPHGEIKQRSLFYTKEGRIFPEAKVRSRESRMKESMKSETKAVDIFKEYGFRRGPFVFRKLSKEVPVNAYCNIRFLLRSLFGIGSRSECILFLLTHEGGHPKEIAQAIGVSVKAAQDMLIELAESNLILTVPKGRRKIEYRLANGANWWEFLTGMKNDTVKRPLWINWISLFSALESVWHVLSEIEKTSSKYLKSSKLRKAMESLSFEFTKSNLALPPIPGRDTRPENYEQEFNQFIREVLEPTYDTGR